MSIETSSSTTTTIPSSPATSSTTTPRGNIPFTNQSNSLNNTKTPTSGKLQANLNSNNNNASNSNVNLKDHLLSQSPTYSPGANNSHLNHNQHNFNVTVPLKFDEYKAVRILFFFKYEKEFRLIILLYNIKTQTFFLLLFENKKKKGSEVTALLKYEGRAEELELSFEYGDLIKIIKIIAKVYLFIPNLF